MVPYSNITDIAKLLLNSLKFVSKLIGALVKRKSSAVNHCHNLKKKHADNLRKSLPLNYILAIELRSNIVYVTLNHTLNMRIFSFKLYEQHYLGLQNYQKGF